jgi:hypothetical protein
VNSFECWYLNPFIGLKPYNNYSPPAKESLHNSETIKIIIQVREIDRETREANNITDDVLYQNRSPQAGKREN